MFEAMSCCNCACLFFENFIGLSVCVCVCLRQCQGSNVCVRQFKMDKCLCVFEQKPKG